MAGAAIIFDLIGRDRSASRAFDDVGRSATRTSDRIGALDRVSKLAFKALVVGTGAAAVGALKLAQGAAEDEAGQKRLARALHNTAGATRGQVASVEDWITAQGKALGVADDDLRPALGQLAGATKDVSKAQDLAGLAMDVSAGSGKSLAQVSTALTKAQNGQVAGLSRLGISTKDAKGKTVSFEEATKRLAALHRGQAANAAETLQGKMGRLKLMLSETGESIGATMLPPLTSLAEKVVPKATKAAEDFGSWLEKNKGQIGTTATALKDGLVPVLEAGANAVKTVAKVFGSLPAPLQGIAVQGAAAALIFPRIAAGAAAASGAVGGFVGGVRNAETRMAALGGAMRSVAGVGGMVALAQGAQQSETAMGKLLTIAGGAATGFALGGPWGAAIGGAGAALYTLARNTDDAGTAAINSTTTWQDYANTLDNVTGAATSATRAMIAQDLQQAGLLKSAGDLGISTNTLVNGVMGQTRARGALMTALDAESLRVKALRREYYEKFVLTGKTKTAEAKAQSELIVNREKAVEAIRKETGEVEKAGKSRAEVIGALKNLPPEVVTQFKTIGGKNATREIANLAASYKLTPKQIQTVITETGAQTSAAKVQALKAKLEETGKVKPTNQWSNMFLGQLGITEQGVRRSGRGINTTLGAIGGTPPNLVGGGFGRGLRGQLSTLRGQAGGQGAGVGAAIGAGFKSGLAGWLNPIVTQAKAIVNAAIAGANAAAVVRSPSRRTAYTGRMMAEGLAVGMKQSTPKAVKQAEKSIKAITGKMQKRLATYKSKMQAIIDFRNETASGVRSGGLFGTTRTDDGQQLNGSALAQGGQDQAARMRNFLASLNGLRRAGLRNDLLQELIGKGATDGGDAAAALLAGGRDAINGANSAQSAIVRLSTLIGDVAAQSQYGVTGTRAKELRDSAKLKGKGQTVHVHIKGFAVGSATQLASEVEKALVQYQRSTGRKLAFSAR